MLTEKMVEIAKECYKKCNGVCPGDSGEVKCFFCAGNTDEDIRIKAEVAEKKISLELQQFYAYLN